MSSSDTGFIGMGIMGRPMASNLAKTTPLLAYDVDKTRTEGIPGVERAESVATIGRQCKVVFMSLPTTAIVESVVEGPEGLLETLSRGAMIVDLSTTMPTTSQRLAKLADERGIEFIDAPVSGGEGGAIEASLSIMVGATPAAFDRAVPYLRTMGGSVVRLGSVGSGGVAKLANNMIVCAEFSVIAEAFALAAKFDIEASTLYEAIRGGWAGSRVLDVSAPAMIQQDYRPGGTVDIMEKDIGYARSLATEKRVPIPVTATAHEVFVAAQARGEGKLAQPVVIRMWEELAGTQGGAKDGKKS